MRTCVYIDAFNLYYGCLRRSPYRWLDLATLCGIMLPRNDIVSIKYFTARVVPRTVDPQQASRQQVYLRALGSLPNLEIVYGHYLSHTVRMPLANPVPGGPRYAEVIKTEEKGSDVNLATKAASFFKQIRPAALAASQFPAVLSDDAGVFTKPMSWY